MKSRLPDFGHYLEQLRQHDPEICKEFDETLNQEVELEGAVEEGFETTPETIVLTQGRPVLDVRRGAAVLEIDEIESQIWKDRLLAANERLAGNIPAVGRIELANHPRGVDWLGTGWVLHDNIVVTNRHVAEVFGHSGGDGFLFRPGFDGTRMRAAIDFLEEFDNQASLEFPLFKIMHIEKGGGPDLAFLRIEPVNGQDLPTPVTLASQLASEGDHVAVVGYPARDRFFPKPKVMDRIFRNRYDKKRLAPGMVIGTSAGRVFHDCSTLGGNSGGEVISLDAGDAVALHFAGTLFTKNHAVPADVVARRLDDVRRGRTIRRSWSGDTEVGGPRQPQFPVGSGDQVGALRSIDATIPIRVRIELGTVSARTAADMRATPSMPIAGPRIEDDVEEITEARPEDYVDRNGYDTEFLGNGIDVPLPELTLTLHIF